MSPAINCFHTRWLRGLGCAALAFSWLNCAQVETVLPLPGVAALLAAAPASAGSPASSEGVSLRSIAVTEGGAGDVFTLSLTRAPGADVVFTLTPGAGIKVNNSTVAISLTFSPANWNVVQTVDVTAIDDALAEGVHTASVTVVASSSDPQFANLSFAPITVQIIDNDSGGVSIAPSGGSTLVTEGGASDSYTVLLTFPPIANVTVRATPSAQVTVNGSSAPIDLTFTPTNWNVSQTVTVAAVDDMASEGLHTGSVSHASISTDPSYSGIPVASVLASVSDNDSPGVALTESGGGTAASESGGTDSYSIALNSQPSNNVTITISAGAQARVNGSASISIVFTPGDWNTPQAVTVSAVNDSVAEGAHTATLTHSAASIDTDYSGIAIPAITAAISDNDTAGVTVTQSGGSTAIVEGGATDSYTIVLNSQPTANVSIEVSADAQTRVNGAATATLTFTTANWNTTQSVTVSAVNDSVAEGAHNGTVTHATTSTDANYNAAVVSSVTANISDNDTAGVVLTESGGSTAVTENGGTDSYDIRLATQPTGNVTVTITPNSQVLVNSSSSAIDITFTTSNWSANQTITVSAVDDGALEATTHTGGISHTAASGDANYNGISISSLSPSISDNDTPGVTVAQSGGSTTATEGGATDTLSIVLNSQPTASVVVTVTPDAQVTANGASTSIDLTFTTANWAAAQTVTVAAVNDSDQEANHNGSISFSVASGDADYNGLSLAAVTVAITDNDVKRLFVSAAFSGNLGGVSGADTTCGAGYRALLVDGTFRFACTSANCAVGGTSEHVNWVLQPNRSYYRSDLTTFVFQTNANGVFPFGTLTAVFDTAAAAPNGLWTGLNADWTTNTNNCSLWFAPIAMLTGRSGLKNSTGAAAISNSMDACNLTRRILCVEQ